MRSFISTGQPTRRRRSARHGFTLVEMMVSITLLAALLLILNTVTGAAGRAWREGQNHTDTFQTARTSLEIVSRELAPAVVDTRMQFVVAPASILTDRGATDVVASSNTLLWMAPLAEKGALACVGYYLARDEEQHFYRLKRIYITADEQQKSHVYFPQMTNEANARDISLRTSAVDAKWFTRGWNEAAFDEEDPNNDQVFVSTAADGVIGFWVRCVDLMGQTIPLLSEAEHHPKSDLLFNSAAYFNMTTSSVLAGGDSFIYLAKTAQSMKANRLPAAIEVTLMVIDRSALARGQRIPSPPYLIKDRVPDVEGSLELYQQELSKAGIHTARTFSTRVKLHNGR